MVHTALTKNPTKKPTSFRSIQITRHQSLKIFHDQLKNGSQYCHHQKYIFQNPAIYCEKFLNNSGYKTKRQYQQPKEDNQNKKKRKRNIIWFNPPYSKSVKTNIRTIFIKLISKSFPPNHKRYTQKRYKEICERTFEKRCANHKNPFNLIKSKNGTILSIEYCTLKKRQQALRLRWEIKG